ncbi:MAG: 30S ribosomal protein S12 methylthiotransferase RimO [Bacteroidales bacterium]|nr:30S ribosomal protein S12 methylthiotransferase RimO [Bacteroidales bacterium]
MGAAKPHRLQLLTLGCCKNRVDSEHLLSKLAEDVEIIPEELPYEESRPDTVIINTCGFIGDAKKESIDEILLAVSAKQAGYVGRVVVCGCLSERYKEDLKESLPEVDAFFGSFQWKEILNWMRVHSKGDWTGRHITTPSHYAYLKIADGCNRKCSYCAIPLIKGPFKSVPMATLVKEAKALAIKGVRELILIAQDTTFYGMDLYGKKMLAPLIQKLSRIDGIEWIRIHYSYPTGFPKDVLKEMAENPKVCKYLDIPLQHSSTKVLKMMRRGVDRERQQSLLDDLRSRVPGIALRTTMIVGHPGEGEAEFNNLLEFVKHNRFEMMGAFTYSEEEGTYDAKTFKDEIPQSVKKRRYARLMKLQSRISLENNLKRVGGVEKVIIDDVKDGFLICRSQKESPEVDGSVIVDMNSYPGFDSQRYIGKFAAVRIVSATEYDLTGVLAGGYTEKKQ